MNAKKFFPVAIIIFVEVVAFSVINSKIGEGAAAFAQKHKLASFFAQDEGDDPYSTSPKRLTLPGHIFPPSESTEKHASTTHATQDHEPERTNAIQLDNPSYISFSRPEPQEESSQAPDQSTQAPYEEEKPAPTGEIASTRVAIASEPVSEATDEPHPVSEAIEAPEPIAEPSVAPEVAAEPQATSVDVAAAKESESASPKAPEFVPSVIPRTGKSEWFINPDRISRKSSGSITVSNESTHSSTVRLSRVNGDPVVTLAIQSKESVRVWLPLSEYNFEVSHTATWDAATGAATMKMPLYRTGAPIKLHSPRGVSVKVGGVDEYGKSLHDKVRIQAH